MTEEEIRLECLKLAVAADTSPGELMTAAFLMTKFVKGDLDAPLSAVLAAMQIAAANAQGEAPISTAP